MSGRITIADVRRAGHCISGFKWLLESYGYNFRDFMKNGMDEDTFLASGDAYAEHVVAFKHGRRG